MESHIDPESSDIVKTRKSGIAKKFRIGLTSRRFSTPNRKTETPLSFNPSRPRTPVKVAHFACAPLTPSPHINPKTSKPANPRAKQDLSLQETRESWDHPFTNIKIKLLIELHQSMQEGEFSEAKTSVKLPKLADPQKGNPAPSTI